MIFSLIPDFLAFIPITLELPDAVREFLENVIRIHPSFFLIALALLPALGMPISPICVLGAAIYGVPMALTFGFFGVVLNLLLTYFLSTQLIRAWLVQFLAKRGHHVWAVPAGDGWRAVLLVRFMPVIPVAVQSYLLGLAGVPFKPFFWVSLPIETLYMAAFVMTAGSFFEGNWTYFALGVSLLIVVVLFAQMIRHGRSAANRAPSE
ncbi:MAG: hypothetical protein B7X06_00110 [Verrucomicrobia bacterium 21-51-4]|nr:MAG: hypothetical protein B7X06_00110 [Verrucomicrobia bacterium 21-51-4]HQU08372.1 VTT domain-containing protein [Opitutales bacterium]